MEPNSFVEMIIEKTIEQFSSVVWSIFYPLRFYILGLLILIIGGILLQISGRRQSSRFNRAVGSLAYTLFSVAIFYISYLIWGVQVIDEIWLAVVGVISFVLTGAFLGLSAFGARMIVEIQKMRLRLCSAQVRLSLIPVE